MRTHCEPCYRQTCVITTYITWPSYMCTCCTYKKGRDGESALEYGCVIWDPHFKKDKKLLESVQYFAVQIATKTWSSHNTSLPLELPSLESRCQYHKLLYAFPFVHLAFFIIKSNPNLRIYHSKCLLQPLAKTVSFSNFFFC